MAIVVVGLAVLFGRSVAALATTGALCVSIVDQPAPVAVKARLFLIDIVAASSVTLLATLCNGSPWLLAPLIAATAALTALISVYGRRALGIGVTAVLSLLFGMATPVPSHTLIFALGGFCYAAIALGLSWATQDRTRQLHLGEALLAFARYVAVKAELYGKRPDFQALIEAHAALVEKLQAARDMIFTSRERRWVAALIALLDTFDTMLSTGADIETLRESAHRHLLARFHALLKDVAQDIEDLATGFLSPAGPAMLPERSLKDIRDEIARIARAGGADITAFHATAHKLERSLAQLQRLSELLDPHLAVPAAPPALDLQPFLQVTRTGLKVLKAQLTLDSPIARYAIRLTLAMVAGYALTVVFPDYIHGGWVMLTTALIMRANYSITRQRRDDRVLGNLAGCLVTMLLVRFLPQDALAGVVVLAIATSHAFGAVDYRLTAFAACVSALLQLHFVAPVAQPVLLERMLDTLIGAGLAWGFSYVLPSWERRNIPKLVRATLAADRAYAREALSRVIREQELRLARKKAQDAAANLSMTLQRFAGEPDPDRRALVSLQQLMAANYLLSSDLASMRILFARRKDELDPQASDAVLAEATVRVEGAFAGLARQTAEPVSRNEGTSAAMALKRRLVHIERAAARVAALGTRSLSYFS